MNRDGSPGPGERAEERTRVGEPARGACRSSRGYPRALLLILAAYVLVQAWTIARSVAPARDGRRYISYALRLETEPWLHVFRTSADHPGYPIFLHAVFRAGAAVGWTSPRERILLAQAATSTAGLVFVILSLTALRRLWGGAPAAAAMLAFVFLPRPASTFADVLSDPAHAALWMASALAFLRALDRGRPAGFALAGFLAALAYWVRVDSLLLAVASLATLVAASIPGAAAVAIRRREAALGALAHATTFAAGLALFALACGKLSTKPVSGLFLLGAADFPPSATLLAALAPVKDAPALAAATLHALRDLAQATQGVHLATALLAVLLSLRVPRARDPRLGPPAVFVLAAFLITLGAIAVIGWKAGYVSSRYFLPILPFVVGVGMHGVALAHERWRSLALRRGWIPGSCTGSLALAVAASLAVSAPSLLGGRLHENSHGLLAAGRFLAQRGADGAEVHDPYFYPTFLAGLRPAAQAGSSPGANPRPRYFIAEERDVPEITELATAIAAGRAETLAEFPRTEEGSGGWVRVYRVGQQ